MFSSSLLLTQTSPEIADVPYSDEETPEATQGMSAYEEETTLTSTQPADNEAPNQAEANSVAQPEDSSPAQQVATETRQSSQTASEITAAETEQNLDAVVSPEGEETGSDQYETSSPIATESPLPSTARDSWSTSSIQDENPTASESVPILEATVLNEALTPVKDSSEQVDLPDLDNGLQD